MRVLLISQHFWPESFRINAVAQHLVAAGHAVSVLTGQPNYPEGRIHDGYRACGTGWQRHPDGYGIYRVPLIPRGDGGAVRLVLNYLSFLTSACVLGPLVLGRRRYDIIFVYASSPILQAIAGMALKRRTGAALVTWVQDLWPQSLEATGFVRSRWLLRIVERVVRWIYRHNDLLLVQSPAFIPPVAALAGNTPVLYHPNPGEPQSPTAGETPSGLAFDRGFNVVFAGNLGTVQALDTILAAAERLRDDHGIRFILIGDGSRAAWLRSEVGRRGLTNVNMPGRFPQEAMPGIFAQPAALLVTLNRDPIMSLTVPSKVQSYLAAGRPIIAALDGEGARLISEAGAGIACPAEDAVALAQAILTLRAAAPEERERMGTAGRTYHDQHFSPPLLTARLSGYFAEVAARRPRWACAN
jgi:glycosyltransferase involved in cell wall biosynthesis